MKWMLCDKVVIMKYRNTTANNKKLHLKHSKARVRWNPTFSFVLLEDAKIAVKTPKTAMYSKVCFKFSYIKELLVIKDLMRLPSWQCG
jgi:hypothetical protein